MFWFTIFFVIVLGEEVVVDIEEPAKSMQAMTETIGTQVWVCRKEIAFELDLIEAFRMYWNEMKGLRDAMGCVIRCVLTKLELMTPGAELMVDNFQAFGEANGANFNMETKYVLTSCLLLVLMRGLSAEDAMKFIATGFMKVLDECKKELNLSDHLITELYHYWKLDYALLQRDMGCAIICMSKKLELMDSSGKLHHGNAKEFAQKHGAAEDLASRMIVVIHDCEKNNEGIEDDCSRVLEVANCFRSGIHGLHYDPKVDVIITEVLTEISP